MQPPPPPNPRPHAPAPAPAPTPTPPLLSQAQLSQGMHELIRGMQQMHMTMLRTRQQVYALAAAQRCLDAGRTPRHRVEFRAQFGEDVLLYDLFDGTLDGFIIEVGAFDGYSLSVSYALEALGWNSLLVEAIPQRVEQCRERRPHARVVHAALSHPDAPPHAPFTVVDDHWGGMLSYLTTHEKHLAALAAAGRPTSAVNVPITTMNALLEGHPPGTIDAAVLDVEGGELDLLRGFDLVRHRPKVLLIEDHIRADSSPLTQYMASQPYIPRGRCGESRVFIHRDHPELAQRHQAVAMGMA